MSRPCWDCATGFVIRASGPMAARKLAAQAAGDEGSDVWLNANKSVCYRLYDEGPEQVVLRAFQNG